MENLFLALLPKERYPILVRYGATLCIVGCALLLRIALAASLGSYPVLLFIPAVFLSALLFDKGSGFFATAVSTLLAWYLFVPPAYSFSIELSQAVPLVLFVIICSAIALVTETLRRTVQDLARAEQAKSLLLEELTHRTRNDLTMMISVLSLQARSHADPAARAAIEAAISRIEVIAKAQAGLRGDRDGGTVEMGPYLEGLCNNLGDLLRDVRPIAVRVRAEPLQMTSSGAVSVGLIVNELVTNAFKYAFPGERGGVVEVALIREDRQLLISVSDDGIGCPVTTSEGLGSRLVRLLAAQLGGTVSRTPLAVGCQVRVTLAYDQP